MATLDDLTGDNPEIIAAQKQLDRSERIGDAAGAKAARDAIKAAERDARNEQRIRDQEARADNRAAESAAKVENEANRKNYDKEAIAWITLPNGQHIPITAPSGGRLRKWDNSGVLWDENTGSAYRLDGQNDDGSPKLTDAWQAPVLKKQGDSIYATGKGLPWRWLGYDQSTVGPDKSLISNLRQTTNELTAAARDATGTQTALTRDIASDQSRLRDLQQQARNNGSADIKRQISDLQTGIAAKQERQAQAELDVYRTQAEATTFRDIAQKKLDQNLSEKLAQSVDFQTLTNTARLPDASARLGLGSVPAPAPVPYKTTDPIADLLDRYTDSFAKAYSDQTVQISGDAIEHARQAADAATQPAILDSLMGGFEDRAFTEDRAATAASFPLNEQAARVLGMPENVAKLTGVQSVPDSWLTPEAAERRLTAKLAGQNTFNVPTGITLRDGQFYRTEDFKEGGLKPADKEIGILQFDKFGVPSIELNPGQPSLSAKSGDYFRGAPEYRAPSEDFITGMRLDKGQSMTATALDARIQADSAMGKAPTFRSGDLSNAPEMTVSDADIASAWQAKRWTPERTRDFLSLWQAGNDAQRSEMVAALDPSQARFAPEDRRLDTAAMFRNGQLSAQDARLIAKTAYGIEPAMPSVENTFDAWTKSSSDPTAVALRSQYGADASKGAGLWNFLTTGDIFKNTAKLTDQTAATAAAKQAFLTEYYQANSRKVDFDRAAYQKSADALRGDVPTFDWAVSNIATTLSNALGSQLGIALEVGKAAGDTTGIKPLTDTEKNIIGGGWQQFAASFPKFFTDRMTLDPSKWWAGKKGGAVTSAVNALKADIDAGTLTAESMQGHRQAIQAAATDLQRDTATGAFTPTSNDILDPQSGLGAYVSGYLETADPSYISSLLNAAQNSTRDRAIIQQTSDYASANGLYSQSSLFGSFMSGIRGGSVAPPQEIGIEIVSALASAGVGNMIALGGKYSSAAMRAGRALNATQRAFNRYDHIAEAFEQFGKIERLPGKSLTIGQEAWNTGITLAKELAPEAVGEFVEESVSQMGQSGSNIGDVFVAGMQGAVGGLGIGIGTAGTGFVTGKLQLANLERVNTRGLQVFSDTWNRQYPESPITIDQLKQAQSYVSDADKVAAGKEYRSAVEERTAALKALKAAPSPTLDDSKTLTLHPEAQSAMDRLAAANDRIASATIGMRGLSEAGILAVQEINGLAKGGRQEVMDAAARMMAGAITTPAQENLLLNGQTAAGKPIAYVHNGKLILSDSFREDAARVAPTTARLFFTKTEAEQLAAATEHAPQSQQGSSEVERRTHNPEAEGSIPSPATTSASGPAATASGGSEVTALAGGSPSQTTATPAGETISQPVSAAYEFDIEHQPTGSNQTVTSTIKVKAANEAEAIKKRDAHVKALERRGEIHNVSDVRPVGQAPEATNADTAPLPENRAYVPSTNAGEWKPEAVRSMLLNSAAAFGYKIVDTGIPMDTDAWGKSVNLGTAWYDKMHPGDQIGQWIDAMNHATNPAGNEAIKHASSIGLHRVWFGHDFATNLSAVVDKFGWTSVPDYLGQLLKDWLTKSGIPFPGVQLLVQHGLVSDRVATDWLSTNIGEVFGGGLAFFGTYRLYRASKTDKLTKPRVVFATIGVGIKLVAGVATAQPFLILSGLADAAILVTSLDQVKAAFKKGAEVATTKPAPAAVEEQKAGVKESLTVQAPAQKPPTIEEKRPKPKATEKPAEPAAPATTPAVGVTGASVEASLKAIAPWMFSGQRVVTTNISSRLYISNDGQRIATPLEYQSYSESEKGDYHLSRSPMVAWAGTIYVDKAQLARTLQAIPADKREAALSAMVDEEVEHFAAEKAVTPDAARAIWNEAPDAAKERVISTYFTDALAAAGGKWQDVKPDAYSAGMEFLRMYRQAIKSGATSEQIAVAHQVEAFAATNPSFAKRIADALTDIARWLREELPKAITDAAYRARFDAIISAIEAKRAELEAGLVAHPRDAKPVVSHETAKPVTQPAAKVNFDALPVGTVVKSDVYRGEGDITITGPATTNSHKDVIYPASFANTGRTGNIAARHINSVVSESSQANENAPTPQQQGSQADSAGPVAQASGEARETTQREAGKPAEVAADAELDGLLASFEKFLPPLAAKPAADVRAATVEHHQMPTDSMSDAAKWALDHLRGTYENARTGWPIGVVQETITHTRNQQATMSKFRVIEALPDIIRNGVFLRTDAPYSGTKSGPQAVHYLYALVDYEGTPYAARLVVQEMREDQSPRKRAYDLKSIELNESVEGALSAAGLSTSGNSRSFDNLTVDQLRSVVKGLWKNDDVSQPGPLAAKATPEFIATASQLADALWSRGYDTPEKFAAFLHGKFADRVSPKVLSQVWALGANTDPDAAVNWSNVLTEAKRPTVEPGALEAATHPKNDIPQPSVAQQEAGNYRKGHVILSGMDISIENPAGSLRSGVNRKGERWQIQMTDHYGYVKRTEGKDGDHLDVFIKPGTPLDWTGSVFVVNQVNPDGKFDEHKAVLGAENEAEAKALYLSNYAKGWKGLGSIAEMPFQAFKEWAMSGDLSKEAVPHAAIVETAEAKPRRTFSTAFVSSGATPVIEWIAEQGGIVSKGKTKHAAGEHDDAPEFRTLGGFGRMVYGKSLAADEAAQQLFDANLIDDPSTPTMWKAIGDEVAAYRKLRSDSSAKSAGESDLEKKAGRFERDAMKPGKGKDPVSAADLHVGDVVDTGKAKLTVTAIDPESFDVTLEDGSTYGIQHLQDGQIIYAENVDEAPPAPKSKLPTIMKNGEGNLLGNDEIPFNLSGELDTTPERQAIADTKQKAADAAAAAERDQGSLFDAPAELPTSESALTPEQKTALDALNAEYEAQKERTKGMRDRGMLDKQDAGKRAKGEAMVYAAKKRKITGELTGIERAAKEKRDASNYVGKPVFADGENGTVTGNPFGRVKVKFEDGTEKTFPPSEVTALPALGSKPFPHDSKQVADNLTLADELASRDGDGSPDARRESRIGLTIAAQRYDASVGVPFEKYAATVIRKRLRSVEASPVSEETSGIAEARAAIPSRPLGMLSAFMAGKSWDEVGSEFGVKPITARKVAMAARDTLRKQLEKKGATIAASVLPSDETLSADRGPAPVAAPPVKSTATIKADGATFDGDVSDPAAAAKWIGEALDGGANAVTIDYTQNEEEPINPVRSTVLDLASRYAGDKRVAVTTRLADSANDGAPVEVPLSVIADSADETPGPLGAKPVRGIDQAFKEVDLDAMMLGKGQDAPRSGEALSKLLGNDAWMAYQKLFRGRLDAAEALAPGAKKAIEDSKRELTLATLSINAVMDGLRKQLHDAFGPAWWNGKGKRMREAVNSLLPTASYLEVAGFDSDGGFMWKPFDRRVGLLRGKQVLREKLKPGDRIADIDGSIRKVGEFISDENAFQLLEEVTAEKSQEMYDRFAAEYPEALGVLDRWIFPSGEASVEGVEGVPTVDFNRYALLNLFNAWPEAMRNDFDELPLGEIKGVDGYTPDIVTQRGLIGVIAAMLGKYKSPGRKFKSGAAREMGNVKNLLDGFSTRALEAHKEKIRLKLRQRLIENAVVYEDQVPAELISEPGKTNRQYVRLDDAFTKLTEASDIISQLSKKDFPHLSGALNPTDQVKLAKIVGEMVKLRGLNRVIPTVIYRELQLSMARQATEGILLRTLNYFLRARKLGVLTAGTAQTNWIGNQLMLSAAAMNSAAYGFVSLVTGDVKGGRHGLGTAAFLLRGFLTDRYPNTLNAGRIGEVIPRDLFDDTTALAALDAGQSYGNVVDDFKRFGLVKGVAGGAAKAFTQGGVSASLLYASHFGGGDSAAKQQIAYAAYRARAEVAADEAGIRKGRRQWMRDWIKEQIREGSAVHEEVTKFANAFIFDYSNVPAWMDPSASLPDETKALFAKQNLLWFPKYVFNMLRFVKRMSVNGAVDTFSFGSSRQERAQGLANLLTLATLGYTGAFLLSPSGGGDGEDDPIVGTRQDSEGDMLDRNLNTSSRVNVSALARRVRLFRMLGTVLRMAGVDLNDEFSSHDGSDWWVYSKNITYFSEAMLAGRAATGDWKNFLKDAGPYITDLATFGGIVRTFGLTKIQGPDSRKEYANVLADELWNTVTAPINPSAITRNITSLVDPVTRRSGDSKSLGFDDNPVSTIESQIPGLSSNVPAAGDVVTTRFSPPADGGVHPAGATNLRDLFFGMGADPTKFDGQGESSRDIAADLEKLRSLGVGPESVHVYEKTTEPRKLKSGGYSKGGNTYTYISYPDPDSVAKRDPWTVWLKMATGLNLKAVPRDAYVQAVNGTEKPSETPPKAPLTATIPPITPESFFGR